MSQRIVRTARQERLNGILQTLLEGKDASPQSLAAHFEVSVMTVHRDLDELQRRGLLRKVHGGVVVERTRNHEIAATLRATIAVTAKEAIAVAAAAHVRAGDVIMIDDSTTAARMVAHLGDIDDLRVVTNYLPALVELAGSDGIAVQALGGDFDQAHESFLGLGTIQSAAALRADTLFFSGSSADASGLFHQEEQIVALKTQMLASSKRHILLLDSSKCGTDSLHLMAHWAEIDLLITDADAPAEMVEHVRQQGVAVELVALAAGVSA